MTPGENLNRRFELLAAQRELLALPKWRLCKHFPALFRNDRELARLEAEYASTVHEWLKQEVRP